MKHVIIALILSAALAGAANGAIIPLDPVVTPSGPNWDWSYDVELTVGSQIQGAIPQVRSGDYFIVYDFRGYVGGSIFAPPGWVSSTSLVTLPPPGVSLLDPDDPLVPDLKFVWTGPTIVNPGLGSLPLGVFGAESAYNGLGLDISAYQNHDNSNPTGFPATGQNQTPVATPVPEPSSIVLALGAIVSLALMRLRRVA